MVHGYIIGDLINSKERKICSPRYYFEKPPAEDIGCCCSCGLLDILGNGLCPKCWDRLLSSSDANKPFKSILSYTAGTGKKYKCQGARKAFKHSKPSWAKGLTKDTDERIARRAKVQRDGKHSSWSKGLTKYDHPSLMKLSDMMKGKPSNRLGRKDRPENP
jgi:hypothetical protein